jgi:hypothetical protein
VLKTFVGMLSFEANGGKGNPTSMKSSEPGTTKRSFKYERLDRAQRTIPWVLGVVTLISVVVLLAWDVNPKLFPAGAHDCLATFPLVIIAVAYLLYQSARRLVAKEILKAIMLAVAFLFWAANQFWANLPQAILFNDIAIALFVLDVFLVMTGWPKTSPDESFAETYGEEPET